jgi:hypothetical protein
MAFCRAGNGGACGGGGRRVIRVGVGAGAGAFLWPDGWFRSILGAGCGAGMGCLTISGWSFRTGGAARGVGATTKFGRRPLGVAGEALPPAAALLPGMAKGCGAIGALSIWSLVTGMTRRATGNPLRKVVVGTTVMAMRRFR